MPKKEVIELNVQESVEMVNQEVKSIATITNLKVVSQPTFDEAAGAMATIRQAKKFLKEKKDSVLNPLKMARQNIEALFEPAENRVLEIETYLKKQIDVYGAKLRAEEAARIKEAEKKIEKGAPIETSVRKFENTQSKIAQIPTYKVWEVEVIDFSKVPDEFKLLDESKAKMAAKSGMKVEGLKFTEVVKTRNTF